MAKYSVDILIDKQFSYSRGAILDKESKCLYFVDAISGEVIRYNSVTKATDKRAVEPNLVTAIPTIENDDHLLLVGSNKLYRYAWSTSELVTLHENNFPDVYMTASIDAKGRLWLGTLDQTFNYGAGVYCLQSDGELVKKVDNKSEAMSIVWSPDNKKMYISDSGEVTVFVYDFDVETGDVSNEKEFVSFAKRDEFQCPSDFKISSVANLPFEEVFEALSKNEMPSSLLMTKSGSLWVCCYYTGRLVRLNANDASIEDEVALPALTPLTTLYGGKNEDEIVVFTVASFITEEIKRKSPDVGKVFRIRKTDGSQFDADNSIVRFAVTSVTFH